MDGGDKENQLKIQKSVGTAFGRKHFSKQKGNDQLDIRLFSAGAPINNPAESMETENTDLILRPVEVESPKPQRKSKFSLEELSLDGYKLKKGSRDKFIKNENKP